MREHWQLQSSQPSGGWLSKVDLGPQIAAKPRRSRLVRRRRSGPKTLSDRLSESANAAVREKVYCPQCTRRVRRGSVRCGDCGARISKPWSGIDRRFKTRLGAMVAGLALATMLGMNYASRNVPGLAEWSTNTTVRGVPDGFLRLLAFTEDERAFYTCARSVLRQFGESSVATFRPRGESTTLSLGNGRYIVRADVSESDRSGTTYSHAFSCTVRVEGSRWIVEELDLWSTDSPKAVPAAEVSPPPGA